jgi:predicted DNA-binding transcriptional regulator AlpA
MTQLPSGFNQDPLLTKDDVVRLLNVSASSVRNLMQRGVLTPIRLGTGMLRFQQSEIDALMTGRKKAPAIIRSGRPKGSTNRVYAKSRVVRPAKQLTPDEVIFG